LGRERAQVARLAAPSSRAFYAAELLKFHEAHGGTPRTGGGPSGHAKSPARQVRNTRVSRRLHGQTEIVVEFVMLPQILRLLKQENNELQLL
jgi:hypothetical protein